MRTLIATSRAPHSDNAVILGGLIHRSTGGSLMVLTVISHRGEQMQAEAILARAKSLLGDAEDIQTRIQIGKRAEELVTVARNEQFDLIIIGEGAQSGFLQRLLGATAQRVIADMPCPVLIARGQPRPIRRILLCESGHVPSLLRRFLNQIPQLLTEVDELTVLHVMSQMTAAPGLPGWELRAGAEELREKKTPEGTLLDEIMRELAALNLQPRAKIRHGLVVREILAEAQSGNYDLVIIGGHRGKGWQRFLLDDLAHEIVGNIDRPLLVI